MRVMRLSVICTRELTPVFLDQNVGVALLCWRAVTSQTATRQQPHLLSKFVVLRQRGSESAYRPRAPMYRDLVRIRKGAALETSLLGPSADVVVTLHEPTYVLEVATYWYDTRRLGARQAKHCLQPYSSVSVTLVENTREKRKARQRHLTQRQLARDVRQATFARQGRQRASGAMAISPLPQGHRCL